MRGRRTAHLIACDTTESATRQPLKRMNLKEIKELIQFLKEEEITEFELERGDVKLRIRRGAAEVSQGADRIIALHSATVPVAQAPLAAPAGHGAGTAPPPAAQAVPAT